MKLKIGSRVAYSVQFLRSIGMSHSDMAHAKGNVTQLQAVGTITLAHVAWDNPDDLPGKVNVANLAIVGPNSRYCAC